MIQALRQIVDTQLRMVQRMPMRRRGSRRRLVRVRHRRRPRHGIVYIDSAVVTAKPGDTAACPSASSVVVMVKMLLLLWLLLLRLRLLRLLLLLILMQRTVVQVMMVVPAVQRARARLIIIMMMPGAR